MCVNIVSLCAHVYDFMCVVCACVHEYFTCTPMWARVLLTSLVDLIKGPRTQGLGGHWVSTGALTALWGRRGAPHPTLWQVISSSHVGVQHARPEKAHETGCV